ncbi:MAG: hypothetical protein AAF629_32530 [Chloroflexota bacterium]
MIETGIEYRINDLRQRDRRAWRLIQEKPCRVIFLYYENSMQETALKLVAAKLKAALTVDGDLADGLAAMEVDDSNLIDALMKAVTKRRTNEIVWNGMDVAQVSPAKWIPQQIGVENLPLFDNADQPTILDIIPDVEEQLQIRRIPIGNGAVQLTLF